MDSAIWPSNNWGQVSKKINAVNSLSAAAAIIYLQNDGESAANKRTAFLMELAEQKSRDKFEYLVLILLTNKQQTGMMSLFCVFPPITLVTLQSFSISGVISAEKMLVEN